MTTKTITEAQLAAALVLPLSMTPEPWVRVMGLGTSTDPEAVLWNTHGEGFTVEQRAETVAHAAFAALPDTGLELTTAVVNPLDPERLARAWGNLTSLAKTDRWEPDRYNAAAFHTAWMAEYARLTSSPTAEESRSNISNPSHSDWHEKGPACEPLIPHYHRKADRIIVWSTK